MFDNFFSCCKKDYSKKKINLYLNINNNKNINKINNNNNQDIQINNEMSSTIKYTMSYKNNISQKVISRNTAIACTNTIENTTSKNINNTNVSNNNNNDSGGVNNSNNKNIDSNNNNNATTNASNENIKNTATNNSITNSITHNFKHSLISFSNFPVSPPHESICIPKELKLILSGSLFFDKEIIITNKGMLNGLRNKEDGQVFFGLKNTKDYTGAYYNDFVLNFQYNSNEINDTSTSRVFDITFSKKTRDYVFYMIHNSLIVYYTISSSVYFEQDKDYIMLIGNVFATFVVKKVENNKKVIHIEIENDEINNNSYADNNNVNETYSFEEKECPITIGRMDCKLIINKPSISKNHAVIEFSKNLNKFYYKDLKSTNGSILLLKDDDTLIIKGEMNFKLENVPFKITEIPY